MNHPPVWKQKQFYISTFNATAGDPKYTEAQLRYHKEAGFNLIEFTFKSREYVLQALPYCEKLGLASLVQDEELAGIGLDHMVESTDESVQRVVELYKPFPHVMGFYVWDEPGLAAFPVCRATIERFRRYAPDKLAFSVMVPSYGIYNWQVSNWDAQNNDPLEERPFARYVRRYLAETDVDVASVDYYPYAVKAGASLIVNDLWRDMGCVRRYAQEAGRPFWFYFQSKGTFELDDNEGSRGMSYEKMAVQTYAALAYGAKQISYFTSSSAVSRMDDQPGPLFEEVKRLNRRMQHLGDFLFHKVSRKVAHSGLAEEWTEPYFLDPLSEISCVRRLPDALIVGYFEDEEPSGGRQYLLVCNKDYEREADGELQLDRPYEVSFLDEDTGDTVSVGVTDSLPLHLRRGEGRLWILKK